VCGSNVSLNLVLLLKRTQPRPPFRPMFTAGPRVDYISHARGDGKRLFHLCGPGSLVPGSVRLPLARPGSDSFIPRPYVRENPSRSLALDCSERRFPLEYPEACPNVAASKLDRGARPCSTFQRNGCDKVAIPAESGAVAIEGRTVGRCPDTAAFPRLPLSAAPSTAESSAPAGQRAPFTKHGVDAEQHVASETSGARAS